MQENSDINREVLNVVKNTHEKAKRIISEHWTSCIKPHILIITKVGCLA